MSAYQRMSQLTQRTFRSPIRFWYHPSSLRHQHPTQTNHLKVHYNHNRLSLQLIQDATLDHHLAETGQSTRSTVERNPECQVLTHLEASSRHRNLLGHPLVTSFLMLKFKKIWLFYLSNLVFHLLYAAMTSVYIYQRSSGIDSSGLKVCAHVMNNRFKINILIVQSEFPHLCCGLAARAGRLSTHHLVA